MQMIVPGCADCLDGNLAILDASDNPDFEYELECDLATHNETHSEEEDANGNRFGQGMAR